MHIVGALIGVDHFEIDQVPGYTELIGDTVSAEHVAGHATITGEGDAEALAHRLLAAAPEAVRRLFTP